MRWGICGVSAIVGVLALFGCASAKEKEFRREANAICAATAKRLDELPKPSSLAQVAKVADREVAIRQDVLAQLGELSAPKDIASGFGEVFAGQEARQARARAVMKAAKDKDEKKLREIREEGKSEYKIEAGRAKAFGLGNCAEL